MQEYDKIIDNMIFFLPVFRGIFMKMTENECINPLHSQYAVLGLLKRKGALPMSEVGDMLGISKSNMTALIDKLIAEKKVGREEDKEDRRLVKISLTSNGEETLSNAKRVMTSDFKEKLKLLDKKEVEELSRDLENVKKIMSKLGVGCVKQIHKPFKAYKLNNPRKESLK